MVKKEMSQILLFITDFRLLKVKLNTDKSEVVDNDSSEITSKPCWNYSLNIIESIKIGEAATINDELLQLTRIAVHQRPSVDVIELLMNYKQLSNAVIFKLSKGIVLPIQVRYALINGSNENPIDDKIFGQSFALDALDTTLDLASANLFVISHQVNHDIKNFNSIVERFIGLVKPSANFLIAAPAAGNNKEITLPALKTKGFKLVSFIPSGADCSQTAITKEKPRRNSLTAIIRKKPLSLSHSDYQLRRNLFPRI